MHVRQDGGGVHRLIADRDHGAARVDHDDVAVAGHRHDVRLRVAGHVAERHRHAGEARAVRLGVGEREQLLTVAPVEHAQLAVAAVGDRIAAAVAAGLLHVARDEDDVRRIGFVHGSIAVGVDHARDGRRRPDVDLARKFLGRDLLAPLPFDHGVELARGRVVLALLEAGSAVRTFAVLVADRRQRNAMPVRRHRLRAHRAAVRSTAVRRPRVGRLAERGLAVFAVRAIRQALTRLARHDALLEQAHLGARAAALAARALRRRTADARHAHAARTRLGRTALLPVARVQARVGAAARGTAAVAAAARYTVFIAAAGARREHRQRRHRRCTEPSREPHHAHSKLRAGERRAHSRRYHRTRARGSRRVSRARVFSPRVRPRRRRARAARSRACRECRPRCDSAGSGRAPCP